MEEREILLKVATPEQWDCWLTKMAEYLAAEIICSYFHCSECCFWDIKTDRCQQLQSPPCLFCHAFDADCFKCMGGEEMDCATIPPNERIDRAIVRLEAAGIWGKPGG